MSKKLKEHKKKVAARNQRVLSNARDMEKQIKKTGRATPNEARSIARIYANQGLNLPKTLRGKI